jgi:superfamily I DNA/RNA helicase
MKYHLLRLSEELEMDKKDIMENLDGLKGLDPMKLMERLVPDLPIDLTPQALNSLKKITIREKNMDSLSLLLQKGIDLLDVQVEGVRLLSIHASKGLEFPVVFIAGCEEGILPMKNAGDDEERRLFYVALTRASEEVYLLSSRKRRLWGRWQELEKSRYIDNILPERIKRPAMRKKRAKKKKRPIQKGLF